MPKWQRAMRKEVIAVIDSAENIFKRVAGLEIEEDDIQEDAEILQDTPAKIEEGGATSDKVMHEDEEASPTSVERRPVATMENNNEASHNARTTPQVEEPANIDVQAEDDTAEEGNPVSETEAQSHGVSSSPVGTVTFRVPLETTGDAAAGSPGADTHNSDMQFEETHESSGNTTEGEDSVGSEAGDSDNEDSE